MAKYPTEMFGHFFYSPDLTYEELHDVEESLIQNIDTLLGAWGGVHIDFSPKGDALGVQCEFREFDFDTFDALAEKIKPLLDHSTVANFVFVDKGEMSSLCIYSISSHVSNSEKILIQQP